MNIRFQWLIFSILTITCHVAIGLHFIRRLPATSGPHIVTTSLFLDDLMVHQMAGGDAYFDVSEAQEGILRIMEQWSDGTELWLHDPRWRKFGQTWPPHNRHQYSYTFPEKDVEKEKK